MIAEFDGADAIAAAWFRGLKPDPALTVWEWADKHRKLSGKGSAEPGPWRTDRTPFLREIMECMSPSHPARKIVFAKGSQIGASETGCNWIGYVIHHVPGPMMAVQPTVEMAKRFSKQRVDPLIEESQDLRALVKPARARDSGNTVFSKEFPGGILLLTGANSATGLRSMPARYLFLDEVDAYPPSVDDEGDPISLAMARTRTFSWRSKIYMASTPTVRGVSRIEFEYELSDRRRYFVPCPHCDHMQWLEFPQLRWDNGRPETAAYECAECGALIEERHKTWMLENGEWRQTAKAQEAGAVGFHLSSLYSPVGWLSWAEIVRQFSAAKDAPDQLRAFVNTVLGETWQERGDAPDWQRLYDRRELWRRGIVPPGGLFLTAGADVQKDRIEISVWAWGRGLESWLVDHLIFDGGPDSAECWGEVTALLSETWPREDGAEIGLSKLAIDAGYESSAVHAWVRSASDPRVMAVMGNAIDSTAIPVSEARPVETTESGRKMKRGARIRLVSTGFFKSETYRFLRLDAPEDRTAYPNGFVHIPDDVEAEWCKQVVAEQLMTTKNRRGYTKQEWHKMRVRNEALDCRVYAAAARYVMGADRWNDARWKRAEIDAASGGVVRRHAPQVPKDRPAPPSTPRRSSDDWLGVGSGSWF